MDRGGAAPHQQVSFTYTFFESMSGLTSTGAGAGNPHLVHPTMAASITVGGTEILNPEGFAILAFTCLHFLSSVALTFLPMFGGLDAIRVFQPSSRKSTPRPRPLFRPRHRRIALHPARYRHLLTPRLASM
jgi:hypothetical protein